jgi:hypothetical protein
MTMKAASTTTTKSKATVKELQQLIVLAEKTGLNLSSAFLKKAIKEAK